jgi:hypothetical protein
MSNKQREPANKRLAVTETTHKRLMERAHYGQSQNGVLVELLNLADKIEHNENKQIIQLKEKEA